MILFADSEGPDQTAWMRKCANVQTDLGLHCLHISEDTFSHGGAHIIFF